MKIKVFLAFLLIAALFSCSKKAGPMQVLVLWHAHLANLPSASGIEYVHHKTYIIGDDIRWLLTLDNHWNITDSLALSSIDTLVNNRTPGNVKADFETLAYFTYQHKDYLMVLSSGSKPITRDTAYLINLPNNVIVCKKNIRPLYEKIKRQAGIPKGNEINIEGLAISENTAYLLHRGNVNKNFIVGMDLKSFMQYLKKEERVPLPQLTVYDFNLPEYKKITPGFSGACIYPKQRGILFTASLEETKSETADGAIRGSYVGYIPFDGLKKGTYEATLLSDKNGNLISTKLESIAIKADKGNKIDVLAVSDNDNGSSEIYELELKMNTLY